ncbi:hypothetical protein ILUMI_25694 [Ignelater luminosus]|uniref:Mitochondrial import inner membrane translocase subunit Tim29 n=1 Tax=Ignelater luminosus TaxID=2038154 RepID=A0A8K0C7Z8_IGNLU|nr:hypothetical protein ILUMI_25694 [Ignelater luminosus]
MLRLSATKQNVVKRIQDINNQALQTSKNVSARFQEKIKGTFMENWVKYWKNVFIDYKAVAVDVKEDMSNKPVKAICIFSFLGSLAYFAKNNPDEVNFRDACLSAANQLMLVHPNLQKQEPVQYLKAIEQCHNQKKLKRLNIGIASIIWTDYYSDSCHIYQADCPHLQVQYKHFKDQMLDIGFLNRWWILNHKMKNYDVNY